MTTLRCPPPRDTIPAPFEDRDTLCLFCGYSCDECGCYDCAEGSNIVLLNAYEEGEQTSV